MQHLIVPALNLAILLSVLFYYLRGPVVAFVTQRHVFLRDEVKNVRDRLRQAQEQYDEFSAKLKSIDVELTAIRGQTKQDAQAAKMRVVSEAQRLSAALVADSQRSAEGLFGDLRGQLAAEFGVRVVDRAEVLLRQRLTQEDHQRLGKDFSHQLERAQ